MRRTNLGYLLLPPRHQSPTSLACIDVRAVKQVSGTLAAPSSYISLSTFSYQHVTFRDQDLTVDCRLLSAVTSNETNTDLDTLYLCGSDQLPGWQTVPQHQEGEGPGGWEDLQEKPEGQT